MPTLLLTIKNKMYWTRNAIAKAQHWRQSPLPSPHRYCRRTTISTRQFWMASVPVVDTFADDLEQIRRAGCGGSTVQRPSRLSRTQNLLPSSLSSLTLGVKRSLITTKPRLAILIDSHLVANSFHRTRVRRDNRHARLNEMGIVLNSTVLTATFSLHTQLTLS